jgi:hypothetical protein
LADELGHSGVWIVVALRGLANWHNLRVRVVIEIHNLYCPHLRFVVAPCLQKIFKITLRYEILHVAYSQMYFLFYLGESEHQLYYFSYWALLVVRICQIVEVRHRVNSVQEVREPCHHFMAFSELMKDVIDGLAAVFEV